MPNNEILEFAAPVVGIALLVVIATLADPKVGLAVIAFSVILSPELHLGRAYLRPEDILIVVGTLAWMALSALMGRKIRPFRLNVVLFIFIFWNLLAFGNQLVFGNLSPFSHTPQNILYSLLTLLKKIEYLFIFFLAANILSSKAQVRTFLWLMFLALIVVDGYAILDSIRHGFSVSGEAHRVSAPFDPEPNTFGQFLMLHILISLSIYPVFPLLQRSLLLFLFLPVTLYAFLFTYSRGSYLALLMTSLLVGIFKDRKVLLGWGLLVGLSTAIFPSAVIHRVSSGIHEVQEWQEGRASASENAFASRVDSFKQGFQVAVQNPLFGGGIGVVPLSRTEAQLPREALETGFIGVLLFIWLLFEVGKMGWNLAHSSRDPLFQAMGWGLVFATIAYSISGFSAIPFTTIRTAFPFWFYTGLVASCQFLQEKTRTYLHFAPYEAQQEKKYQLAP